MADLYLGQGYDVNVWPSPDQLPPFARDFKVEVVARRGTEGVLVAVRKDRDAVAADANMQLCRNHGSSARVAQHAGADAKRALLRRRNVFR